MREQGSDTTAPDEKPFPAMLALVGDGSGSGHPLPLLFIRLQMQDHS